MKKTRWFIFMLPLFAFVAISQIEDDNAEGEIYTLPHFVTKTSAMSDYIASESVTGTRVAARIEDLPFTVNVVTSEFMDDFNLIEYKDQFSYVSNVGQAEGQSPGYTLRGFTADVQLRNGFRRIGLIDKVNVDRVEVVKGPAASIYGAVVPGGAVNVITKKPSKKESYRIKNTIGLRDLVRSEVSATGPIGGEDSNVQYRFDAAYYERGFETTHRKRIQYSGAFQLAWQPSERTNILFEAEYLDRDEPSNTSATIPFVTEKVYNPYFLAANPDTSRSMTRYLAIATDDVTYTVGANTKTSAANVGDVFDVPDLTHVTTQGPETYADRDIRSYSATLEHQINDIFSFRSGFNHHSRELDRVEVGSRDKVDPITGLIARGKGRLRLFPETGTGWQNDLLASFETGGIKHKLLVTLDYQRATDDRRQYEANTSAAFPDDVASGLDPFNPNYDFVTYYEDPSIYTPKDSSSNDNVVESQGIFVSERMTMMEDRLNLMIGGRYDKVETSLQPFKTVDGVLGPYGDEIVESDDELTYQLGANFRVTNGVTVFASASSSFQPQLGAGNRFDSTGEGFEAFVLPNERGTGVEGGVKLSLLKERLGITLSYFDIRREDVASGTVSVSLTDDFGDEIDSEKISDIRVETAKGYEFDFSWVVSEEFQIFGAYGYNDAKIEDATVARYAIGDRLRRSPKHNAGIAFKYQIMDGALKGLFFSGGIKYTGDSQANKSGANTIKPKDVSESNPFTNLRMENGLLALDGYGENEVLTVLPQTVLVSNGRGNVMNEAYTSVDVGVGYKWKTDKYSHKVQANIRNLLDVQYTYGSSAPGEGLMASVTYDLKF